VNKITSTKLYVKIGSNSKSGRDMYGRSPTSSYFLPNLLDTIKDDGSFKTLLSAFSKFKEYEGALKSK
jgi:hypothetical protein